MSDLHRAVQAEINAWAPRAAPPALDALAARKRSRDRRRLAAGGAALSAVVVAAAAVLAPSLGTGGDRLAPGPVAAPGGPGGESRQYHVQPSTTQVLNTNLEAERDACFALPGVAAVGQGESNPVAYVVTVTGEDEVTAFEGCIEDVVGLLVPELAAGTAQASVTQARRGCGPTDGPTLVGEVTGARDGATVEVVDGDGQSRGTAQVANGKFTVHLGFRGYTNPQAVPTSTPGGVLVVRGLDGTVLTAHPFDLTDSTDVPICG